jgi:nitrite reductase (NADH) small subunit
VTAARTRVDEVGSDLDTDPAAYTRVCRVDEIEVEGGVAALVDGEPVAIFLTYEGDVHAMSNVDPYSRASVMARGIVGTRLVGGREVVFVASPMHKQAFCLQTGECLDDAAVRIPVHEVRVVDGDVLVGPRTH